MAQVPYEGGVPEVAPQTSAPDDYQRIQTNPNMFGGAIASGEDALGKGAAQLGSIWGEVQTDSVLNNAMKEMQDATQGYENLRGQDALNAQPQVQKQIDDIYTRYKGQVGGLVNQHRFDASVRPFMDRYIAGKISTHSTQQGYEYAAGVNKAAISTNYSLIPGAPDDDTRLHLIADAGAQAVKQAHLTLGDSADENAVAAQRDAAISGGFATWIESETVKNPIHAQQLLEKYKPALGTRYTQVADFVKSRADKAVGDAAGTEAITATQGKAPPPAPAGQTTAAPGPAVEDSAAMLRHFEGFRDRPYWDVNHWRVGYGSDTITKADGSVEPVTPFTNITRADADRDLARRVQETQVNAAAKVGGAVWNGLPAAARASLTSVAYNYGQLPDSIAAAARTGDPNAIAQAIQAQSGANGGVNAKRRAAEAANVLGRFGISGAETAPTGTAYRLPPQASQITGEDVVGTQQPATQAADVPPPLPAPEPPNPEAPAQPPASPEEQEAAAMTHVLNNPDLTPDQRNHAIAQVKSFYMAQAIATEATAKAKKQRAEHAADGYLKEMITGSVSPDIVKRIGNDPSFNDDPSTRLHMWELAKKASGEQDLTSMGPKYSDALSRILLPGGDPNRINDATELWRMAAEGDLTTSGAMRLRSIMNDTKKSVDGTGVAVRQSTALKIANQYLSYEQDLGPVKIPDPIGAKAYNDFVNQFYSAYDKWTGDGKDPADFPLFKTEEIRKATAALRKPSQMAIDRVNATGGSAANEPNVLPPAPAGVDPQGWSTIMSAPPRTATGQPMSRVALSRVIGMLLADPSPKNVAAFDASQYGRAGLSGEAILSKLRGGHTTIPEGVAPPIYAE